VLLAQDQADRRLVGRVLQAVVDHVAVEVQLARILGLELAFLQVDDDERPQPQVVEQQVEVEVLVAHIQAVLAADERESLAQFEQELLHVADKLRFEFALVERLGQREEVEDVRILERLLGQVRLRRREQGGEVGNRLAVSGMGLGIDLESQDIPGPAVGERTLHVPATDGEISDFLHQDNVMSPGNGP